MLSETQKKFVDLEKQKQEHKAYFKELNEAAVLVASEIGIGGSFQDEDGTVYQIVVPDGKFVSFEHISYVRTRRAEERAGDLSLKKAKELGYSVES